MAQKNKFVQAKNNKNILIDVTKDEKILDLANNIASSDAFDPEILSRVKLNIDSFNHICLVNLADVHFFDEGMQKIRFDAVSGFLKDTSNAYGVLSGDTFTVSTLNGASNAHVNKLNNAISAKLGEECLTEISDKLVFGVGGNHDGEHGARNRDHGTSLTRSVLNAIGVPYFQYNVLLEINISDNRYYVFVTHGSGKASTKASAIDTIKNKCKNIFKRFGIFPNLVLTGHFHADVNGRYTVQVPVIKDGQLISTKTQELIIESAPALQGDSEFTTSHSIDITRPNVNAFDISFARNPYFNSKNQNSESPIVWTVTKFPLLRKKADKLSIPARVYNEMYKEPKDVKKEIDKLVENKGVNLDSVKRSLNSISEEIREL